MKSIKARHDRRAIKFPYWSSIMCFNSAVFKQGFSEKSIKANFSKLVDKGDYFHKDKKDVIAFAIKLSEEGSK